MHDFRFNSIWNFCFHNLYERVRGKYDYDFKLKDIIDIPVEDMEINPQNIVITVLKIELRGENDT